MDEGEFDTACCSTSTPVKGSGAAAREVDQEEELDLEIFGLDEESIGQFHSRFHKPEEWLSPFFPPHM